MLKKFEGKIFVPLTESRGVLFDRDRTRLFELHFFSVSPCKQDIFALYKKKENKTKRTFLNLNRVLFSYTAPSTAFV